MCIQINKLLKHRDVLYSVKHVIYCIMYAKFDFSRGTIYIIMIYINYYYTLQDNMQFNNNIPTPIVNL